MASAGLIITASINFMSDNSTLTQ